MDLLVVGDVVLCEDTFDLFEVPVWDVRHLVDLVRRIAKVTVLAIGPIYAEAKPIVVTGAILNVILPFVVGAPLVRVVVIVVIIFAASATRLVIKIFVWGRFHMERTRV